MDGEVWDSNKQDSQTKTWDTVQEYYLVIRKRGCKSWKHVEMWICLADTDEGRIHSAQMKESYCGGYVITLLYSCENVDILNRIVFYL